MRTSTAAVRSSTNVATTPQFWERLWRTAGMLFQFHESFTRQATAVLTAPSGTAPC